ncbi:LysM peptidoglycan-binding domain-containing protein [Actinotalea sp. K2]|uniref:lytic transglycosylase n=1 Tax=Actinotalea sp. K2 TaxID=2939438 RepID=UPI002017351B|nr:LysM peptidoglycan-binding domain-containing protein [Actinotalea sp. K2]MCL3862177.1 LysM peptidoglycan-binding domain-containing protein [Actinotalea sp. K2]
MTDAALRTTPSVAERTPARPYVRRAAGGTGVGLALAVASVTGSATPAAAQDYTVQPGDTVSHIAQRTSTTVQKIVAANGLDQRASIRAGQKLSIPTATATAPATAPTAAPASHTVAAGDTVSALALRYGTTTGAIIQANGLNASAMIRVGQALSIPTAGAASAASPAATAPAGPRTHAVTAGQTVSGLAATYGTTTSAIIQANGLNDAALIRIGQSLTIPGASAAPSAAPTAGAPVAPAAAARTHTVTAGQTVSGLAITYGTTTSAIIQANGLNASAMIRIGQNLTIPGTSVATPAPTTLVGNTFAGRTYPEATVSSANQNKATLLDMGVPSKAQMQALVVSTARDMGVDPALAQAIAFQESGFNHTSVSPANAIGTMQVIPSSGQWASDLVGRQLNLLDPTDNVTAGVAILRRLVDTSPDLPTAIASYYQGQAGVKKHGMYPDTRRYVASVQTLMSRFA